MNNTDAKPESCAEIDEILKKIKGEPYNREKVREQFERIEEFS